MLDAADNENVTATTTTSSSSGHRYRQCLDVWHAIRHFDEHVVVSRTSNDAIHPRDQLCYYHQALVFNPKLCNRLWVLLAGARNKRQPQTPIVQLLPHTLDEARRAERVVRQSNHKKQNDTSGDGSSAIRNLAWQFAPNAIRSIDWLQQHGHCVDHLEAKPSTLDRSLVGGSSGAFAKRFLPKGSRVAPAPLIHMHRKHLEILLFDNGYTVDDKGREESEPVLVWKGHQLLLNYVYGHSSTSLVFFPYSPVVNFINHASSSLDDAAAATANVKLQWSSHMSHPEWLNSTVDEVLQESHTAGLMMELVALRDIEVGEEIFLDYGREWQKAWDRHVEEWHEAESTFDSTRNDDTTFGSVQDYAHESIQLPTADDDQGKDVEKSEDGVSRSPTNRLASNLMTVCFVDNRQIVEHNKTTTMDNGTNITTALSYCSCQPNYDTTVEGKVYRCTLLSRTKNETNADDEKEQQDSFSYTVQVQLDDDDDYDHNNKRKDNDASVDEVVWIIQNFPRSSIQVVNRPYTDAQFLRRAFRHEIHVPDDMVPPNWRDLESTGEEPTNEDNASSTRNDLLVSVRTTEEQAANPYPDNIYIGCIFANSSIPTTTQQFGMTYTWKYQRGMYDHHVNDDNDDDSNAATSVNVGTVVRCQVLERHGDDIAVAESIRPTFPTYTVRAWHHDVADNDDHWWIVTNVPRRAIQFFETSTILER